MRHLQFLGKYIDDLINGKKTITIRITKPKIKVGEIFIAHAGGKVIGKFRVKRIYTKKIKEIDEEEAKKDGYNSKEEMIDDLKRIYKNIDENKEMVVIEFEPIEIFKEKVLSEEFAYGGKKINVIELAKLILEKTNLSDKEKELLKILIEEGSIRKAARRLGGLKYRDIFRKILRKGFRKLHREGII